MAFENIIGNEKIKQLLTTWVMENNLVHSYLFVRRKWNWKKAICHRICKNDTLYARK